MKARTFAALWVGCVAFAACTAPAPLAPSGSTAEAAYVLDTVARAAGVAAKCALARDEVCVEQGAELFGALLDVLRARGAGPLRRLFSLVVVHVVRLGVGLSRLAEDLAAHVQHRQNVRGAVVFELLRHVAQGGLSVPLCARYQGL